MSFGQIWKKYPKVFLRYPTSDVKNIFELPFMRISPNTMRRSQVVFGVIQGYLFLIPQIKVLKSAQNFEFFVKVKIKILLTYCIRALLNHFRQGISIVNHKLGLSTYLYPAQCIWVCPCVNMFTVSNDTALCNTCPFPRIDIWFKETDTARLWQPRYYHP